MLNLDGLVTFDILSDIKKYTATRFKYPERIKAAEALTLYEQNYLPEEDIKKLCESTYGIKLYEPMITFMPKSIIQSFDGSGLIPITHRPMKGIITAVYLPDIEYSAVEIVGFNIEVLPTTVHFYFKQYNKYYGEHSLLLPISAKEFFNMIVQEATSKGASDITISTTGAAALVYYNIRKSKVYSHRLFPASDMRTLITILFAKNPYQFNTRLAQECGVELNEDYTGRVECSAKYKGFMITIRVFPKEAFNLSIEDLGFTSDTAKFLHNEFLDDETGLHLIVGATMSGKNTTATACLRELSLQDKWKIVSVEMPVEQEIPGVEQKSCETEEEYEDACKALIRENPDMVYIVEMNDKVGKSAMRVVNTGKAVISTLHANSVAGALTRIQDITDMSIDRILFGLHSIVYQELRRDGENDRVFPYNRYVRFTKELKSRLYGKTIGEMINVIDSEERGDDN